MSRATRDHALEALLARAVRAMVRALPWRASLMLGARLGDLARLLGLRRAVAEDNLARAFPERSDAERRGILHAHYRDLGMMMCEAARGGAVLRTRASEVVAHARGFEHLESARQAGRGAIVLTAHYGDFGMLAAWLGRSNGVDIFGKALENPAVEALLVRNCEEAGVRRVVAGHGLRQLVTGLRENRWAVMLGDQDAGTGGVFVPFMGRLCSTTPAPAQLSLRTGASLIMAFITRRADGRHEIDVLPPLLVERPGAPDAVARLTALHTATLEQWVRRHPHMWFWLHRRWKTAPPAAALPGAGGAGAERPPVTAAVALAREV